MGAPKAQVREMMREEAEIADEKRLAAKIIAQAKVMAPRLATMGAISEHRSRWVAYKVCCNKMPRGTKMGLFVGGLSLTFDSLGIFPLFFLCFVGRFLSVPVLVVGLVWSVVCRDRVASKSTGVACDARLYKLRLQASRSMIPEEKIVDAKKFGTRNNRYHRLVCPMVE